MERQRCSHTPRRFVETGHINSDVSFFILFSGRLSMLSDVPLFTFELEVIYYCNKFWLVEWAVYWNGQRTIVEMVEIDGGLDGYVEEN
jgi:hypothetical protein